MKKLFDMDGPVIGALEKCCQMIVLSALWLLTSIPLITLVASTAALYDGVLQTLRGKQGSTAKIFWHSFRRNFLRGCGLGAILGGIFAALETVNIWLTGGVFPSGVILVLMILDAFVGIFAPSVLARTAQGIIGVCKEAFVLSLQFAHYTLILLLGTVALIVAQFFLFPMALVFILPAAWCWCCSYLTKKALRRYPENIAMQDEI